MCNTPLPSLASSQTRPQSNVLTASSLTSTKSAPSSRPASPDLGDDDEDSGGIEVDPARHMIKLSFRKGGDKAFYAVLKRSLMGKAWEVSMVVLYHHPISLMVYYDREK
jgi:ESCRT-II complex subunit VPS36